MTDDPSALAHAAAWLAAGQRVALATVVDTWGSSPRPVGSLLAVAEDGRFAGSVSGGCIEGAVVEAGLAAMRRDDRSLIPYGVDDDVAQAAGLACGGKLDVYIEPVDDPDLIQSLRELRPVARVVDLTSGDAALIRAIAPHDDPALGVETQAAVAAALAEGTSRRVQADGRDLFVAVYVERVRLFLVGAGHIAQVLSGLAEAAGLPVVVVDPRDGFAEEERFRNVEIRRQWPDDAFRADVLDARSALVALAHDPRLDDPALLAALASPAFYVGALGSRRSHAKRLDRLRAAGQPETALKRIHGPVGLDLGGRSASEIAIAILAEIVAVRHGRRP